jgi:hypothetical protein
LTTTSCISTALFFDDDHDPPERPFPSANGDDVAVAPPVDGPGRPA